ncbi:hypothetical protein EUGRSUZ_F03059 [Eucalyptus grandis]|uniref:Uncharacterized protein n=2 Tax=Eucalyptus grandis TaxID=71139 RepID=A0ACC3KKW5_EUCGR|nr:hypothetical protein EUGRSUZ_F03059 [Eucalyptus grandis]
MPQRSHRVDKEKPKVPTKKKKEKKRKDQESEFSRKKLFGSCWSLLGLQNKRQLESKGKKKETRPVSSVIKFSALQDVLAKESWC